MADRWLEETVDQTLGLSDQAKALLAGIDTHRVTLQEGQALHHTGDEVSSLYCVVSGWMTSVCNLVNGDRQLMNFYTPYDMAGFEYLGRSTAISDFVAWERSELVVIPIPTFKKAVAASPVTSTAVASLVSRKLGAAQTRISVYSNGNAKSKLIHLLHGLRSRQVRRDLKDVDLLRTPLTQKDIADTIGTTNVTVSRLFADLEDIGCLTFKQGEITITDYEMLMDQTDGHSREFYHVDEFV
jgi:CRP-like cAMP-binding protein